MIEPLGKQVCILPDPATNISAAGLQLDQAKVPHKGTVVAVGPDQTSNLKKGDRVVYSKYVGVDAEIDGIIYKFAKDVEIFSKI